MKAIVYTRYGSPDVLRLEEVPTPLPRDNEVLVRIRASVVTPPDTAARSGNPAFARLYFGLLRPKVTILGSQFAGEITAIGSAVRRFAVGDRVVGGNPDFGAHAEYLCVPEDSALAPLPSNLGYEDAVAIFEGAMTALPFLRETANLQPGQTILINGASGSVGTAAVQLARHLGAEVTAVCSAGNTDLVKSLGADKVIDYVTEDFTRAVGAYDVIFDTVNRSSYSRSRRSLKRGGIYLATSPSPAILLQMLFTSRFGRTRAAIAFTGLRNPVEKAKDLASLSELAEAGAIVPVIDRRYPLDRTAEAHEYVDTGRKKGNVVITM